MVHTQKNKIKLILISNNSIFSLHVKKSENSACLESKYALISNNPFSAFDIHVQ